MSPSLDDSNPYAAADVAEPAPDDPVSVAKRRLSKPATALIVMASIQSVLSSIVFVSNAVMWSRRGLPQLLNSPYDLANFAVSLFLLAALIAIAVGAAKMGHLESYKMARIGATMACIPLLTPFVIVGIPFGLESRTLLKDPEIIKAFELAGTLHN